MAGRELYIAFHVLDGIIQFIEVSLCRHISCKCRRAGIVPALRMDGIGARKLGGLTVVPRPLAAHARILRARHSSLNPLQHHYADGKKTAL